MQYTRAIAEGFSKQSFGKPASNTGAESTASTNIDDHLNFGDLGNIYDYGGINFLDGHILLLEESGSRWRNKRETKRNLEHQKDKVRGNKTHLNEGKTNVTHTSQPSENEKGKKRNQKPWFPVTYSSSFSPHWIIPRERAESFDLMQEFTFVALWSRNTQCTQCGYIPLDEEIQGSWDKSSEKRKDDDNMQCPGCRAFLSPPKLGFSVMEFEKSSGLVVKSSTRSNPCESVCQKNIVGVEDDLPPQLRGSTPGKDIDRQVVKEESGFVPYLSPSVMRIQLEKLVNEHGEDILEREQLRKRDPSVFYNLWWYCCRFSVPLPLSIEWKNGSILSHNSCAFAAYEKELSLQGCVSAAKTVLSVQSLIRRRRKIESPLHDIIQSFDNKSTISVGNSSTGSGSLVVSTNLLDDDPLLSNISLQAIVEGDWSHNDLAPILVKLFEACEKKDLLPVLDQIIQCNKNRRAKYGSQQRVEVECYHTLLYLTRYQCTSAFHKFFPSTCKICKGYHFWVGTFLVLNALNIVTLNFYLFVFQCPHTAITIFDRMFRDALNASRKQGENTPVHNISDIALGFRSVFGHII